jgi:high affinity Mn2+ porin
MGIPFAKKTTVLALAMGLGLATSTHAATNAELAALLEKLSARVQKLEETNADLQRQLAEKREASAASASTVASAQTAPATTTAQAVEPAGDKVPTLEERLKGVTAGVSLTMVAQKSYAPGVSDSQLSYRGDAFVSLPLPSSGDVEQSLFAMFRMGQGAGLGGLPSYSKPNASAFQLGGGARADDALPLLAQAWYQANIPMGVSADGKRTLEVTVGKMDPFVFFDQNAVAGDESRQFMNSVFVHNPLLDAGGDIGFDANGFMPGLRFSLVSAGEKDESWRVSLGLLGAGPVGSNYKASLGTPLVMLQVETARRLWGDQLGNYRLYTWSNPQASHFDPAYYSPTEVHTGWGFSLDQKVGDSLTLFSRYGHETSGNVRFDRALTLGGELSGAAWGRGDDGVGLGLGWLRTSDAYADFTASTTRNSGTERVAELYYRYHISKQFAMTPSLQYVGNPGGDPAAADVRVLSLRGQFNF